MSADEVVDLYDESGRVVGSAPRSEVRAHNLPHAATAVLVNDETGRVYVHRRTDTKDLYPGLHDVWAGGVITAGEQPDQAAARELGEELGLVGLPLRRLFTHWYADEHTTYLAFGYDTVYRPERDGPIRHQPSEVASGEWLSAPELQARLADPGWGFVPDGRRLFEVYEQMNDEGGHDIEPVAPKTEA